MTRSLLPFAGALALVALAGCNKAPSEVLPAEGPMGERLAALEQEVKTLKDERDAAQRAGNAAGLEAQSLGQMLSSMSARLKAMEEAARASGGPTPAMGTDGSTPSVASTPSGAAVVVLTPTQPDGTYSEEQITSFRKLEDEVAKRKKIEDQAKRFKQFLTTAGITLAANEEQALQRLQVTYGEKMQELMRDSMGMGTTEPERLERREKINVLRQQYETEIRAQVSADVADKVVEGMLRTGGFPRRTDGRAGMNGAMPGR
jgi:hypothetical protein